MLFSTLSLFCIQACLVQTIIGQCIRPYTTPVPPAGLLPTMTCDGALDVIAAPFVASVTAPYADPFLARGAADAFGAYGGAGNGEAAVVGELPAMGTTALAGEVPILGAVEFGGLVPVAGTVTIAGTCACNGFY